MERRKITVSQNLLPRLLPVGEKQLQALVGQRVFDEGLEDGWWHGRDIGAQESGLLDVVHGADRSRQDVGRQLRVVIVDRSNLADQLHAVQADVIKPADEGRDESCAGLGGEQSLVRGK